MIKLVDILLEAGFIGDITDAAIEFLKRNDVDYTKLKLIGAGTKGYAYEIDSKRVLKITSSSNEYDMAKKLKGKKYVGLANIYDCIEIETPSKFNSNKIRKFGYIILEKLEIPSTIYELYGDVESLLLGSGHSQDMINVLALEEDIIRKQNSVLQTFIRDLIIISKSINKLGYKWADISEDNLGYDKGGNLKLFDISTVDS